MSWLVWGVLLLLQQGSQTLVSRARNSRSIGYHAIAAVGSNGVWFVSLGFAMDKIAAAWRSDSLWLLFGTAAFYTGLCVTGSVAMHHFLMRRIERGDLRVGG
jgi:hypothetical protein